MDPNLPLCLCGHNKDMHRRPFKLIQWLWTFEYIFWARPCKGIYYKEEIVKCTCPGYRLN